MNIKFHGTTLDWHPQKKWCTYCNKECVEWNSWSWLPEPDRVVKFDHWLFPKEFYNGCCGQCMKNIFAGPDERTSL